MGSGALSAGAASLLAQALVWQGRTDEAEPFTRVAEQHTPADDVFTQMEWRSAHALVLRGRGDHAAAEKLARGAVAIAEATDYLESSARANCALAEVLAGSGQVREAAQWLEEARRLYERKESVFGVKRTRARLPELVGEALAERD
jgi:ATP/maltotriose-dependent transcriptional regulator MalT